MTLLAAYSFDEAGNTATDYTSNGNDFSIASTSVARTASGHTNGGVTLGSTPAQMPATLGVTSNRTVMCWLKGTPSASGWAIIWFVTSLSSGAWGILWLTDRVVIQARNSSTFARATQSTAWDGTAWHHVAGTWDGSNIRLYIDGTLNATTAMTGPIRSDSDKVELGLTATGWTCDDVRVYDAALDQATISSLMSTPVTGPTYTDAGTATLSLSASGTATVERSAAGTATVGLTASGVSTVERSAAGTATIGLSASGSSIAERVASGTATLVLAGSGTATKETASSGTGVLALAGTGTSLREAAASGTSSLALASAGTAVAERTAAGTATLALTATGVTPADLRDITLTVTPAPSRWTVTPAPSRWTVREA